MNCSDPKEALFHEGEAGCRVLFNASFQPMFFTDDIFEDNSTLRDMALSICGNNTACLFDVARTKSLQFGRATRESQERAEKRNAEESEFVASYPKFEKFILRLNIQISKIPFDCEKILMLP